VTGPPATRHTDIRLSPADGITLSRGRYELRARDGRHTTSVPHFGHAKADAINLGHFEANVFFGHAPSIAEKSLDARSQL
jgi:hypothetical protein